MKYRLKIDYWEQCNYKKGDIIEAGGGVWDIPFVGNNPDIFEKVEETENTKEIEKLTYDEIRSLNYDGFGNKVNELIDYTAGLKTLVDKQQKEIDELNNAIDWINQYIQTHS